MPLSRVIKPLSLQVWIFNWINLIISTGCRPGIAVSVALCMSGICLRMKKLQLSRYLVTLFSSLIFSFCASQDNLVPGESISANKTLTSSLGTFALGFFTPQNSTKYYLGIWYNTVPRRDIVWVANRQSSLDSPGFFSLGEDGNLVVLDEAHKAVIWSSNVSLSSSAKDGTTGLLMDSGNLVLKYRGESIWESFHHPTDTVLLGMKVSLNKRTGYQRSLTSWAAVNDPRPGKFTIGIDPTGRGQILIRKDSKPYSRSELFIGKGTKTALSTDKTSYNFSYNFNTEEVYFTYGASDSSAKFRARLNPNGLWEVEVWLDISQTWFSLFKQPVDICELYAHCGPYGACQKSDDVDTPTCMCLTGFRPKSPTRWAVKDWSGGCISETPFKCDNRSKWYFSKFERLKLPDSSVLLDNKSMYECESTCYQNCSCTAYAYVNSIEGNNIWKCFVWFGDLLDIVENQPSGPNMYVRVHNSEQVVKGPRDNSKRWRSLVIPIVSATAGVFTIVSGYFVWKKTWGKRREFSEGAGAGAGANDIELPLFGLKSILAATNNFAEANKLGEGGFGPVYKGIIPENQQVAVKRLSKNSAQGHHEFMNELQLIAKLQHTNLVRLLGCCIEAEEMILIYEYMPNRSLDKFLFDPSEKTKLDWDKRFQIIEGIAQGILYIHRHSRLKIIHRDLKASNVLLDEEMNPKISDFGMAKIFEVYQTEANTNRVVGTYGYMSPEYARYGHFSEKLDVFSFGVLLLEILSGKRNGAFHHFEHSPTLAGWAWKLWKEGKGMEVIDESLRETCRSHEALRCIHVGFLCVQESPADRPTMSTVIHMLQTSEPTSLPSSKEPAFSRYSNSNAVASSSISTRHSNNEFTISIPVGR